MLNLDETLSINSNYLVQKDLILKGTCYFFGVFFFLEYIRSQVSEVNLLQLVPGFYLLLFFLSFIILVFSSNFLANISKGGEIKKEVGTKTLTKLKYIVATKFRFFLLFTVLLIILNSIIPLSLDSFNSYGERTLENLWSIDEVINLEAILLIILIFLSQFPSVIVSILTNEIGANYLPEFWKPISLIIFLASGFLTPTIDGYTQLSFAFSALMLYLLVINVIKKRITIKINVLCSLS